jgi:predicted amidophosphoribosyltransferase
MRDRGFNQISLIAEYLSEYYKCKYESSLIQRVKGKDYQSKKILEERSSINSSYFTIKKKIKNKDIILIDDVISTGTTINSLADLLKGNNVIAIALFRGSPSYRYLRK